MWQSKTTDFIPRKQNNEEETNPTIPFKAIPSSDLKTSYSTPYIKVSTSFQWHQLGNMGLWEILPI
jgi:hypothetical protein